jgi:hypothetical protein
LTEGWKLETTDGKTAMLSLNAQQYDLSKGALFLVKTAGGQTQVQQIKTDLSMIQPTNEGCKAFSEANPDVSNFIHQASESK